MSKRKIIGLATLYLGIALGLPLLLILGISQFYPIFGDKEEQPTPWQLVTQRLIIQPQGQIILPPSSAFVPQKGAVTILYYPWLDHPTVRTQLLNEGTIFSTQSGQRYGLLNRENNPIEILLVSVRLEDNPNGLIAATPTPAPKGYSLEVLSRRFLPGPMESNELKQYLTAQLGTTQK